MYPWQKETLNLQVGDFIVWQDVELEGQPALVSQGMKGHLLSLNDGFRLDVLQGGSVLPKAIVEFENGVRLMVDERMKWERVGDQA